VPARRVFAAAELAGVAVCPDDIDPIIDASRERAAALLRRVQQTETGQIRQLEWFCGPVGSTSRAIFCDMAEGIRSGITETIRIGGCAETERIHHQ
jgi:hypothetical protein